MARGRRPEYASSGPGYTGISHAVECFEHNGFRNFRIITLHLEDGEVVKTEYSQPYANFEVIARLEVLMQAATLSLNDRWLPGRVWQAAKVKP